MKKTLLLLTAVSLLAGCGSKDKNAFEQALVEQFANDPDITDYNISPTDMAACVLDGIRVPGPPWGSDKQAAYYQAYTQLLAVREQPSIAAQALKDAKTVFGSAKKATAAALSISSRTMECVTIIVGNGQITGENKGD